MPSSNILQREVIILQNSHGSTHVSSIYRNVFYLMQSIFKFYLIVLLFLLFVLVKQNVAVDEPIFNLIIC